ncbi:MAG TPA: NADH-quinone oxidoreductase subunit H [candidate division WOR-3 bacterium]|uniref:NADH-quinone oxidoreductase subunit H n=1 Tax=candidate division WOR-3 bacterium TaxID=2052148 RepID=A0A7C5H5S8_UNCW3|nr:NADH-quinone oxidoreductase subunit H [candidate division WOR-3 bacterium]
MTWAILMPFILMFAGLLYMGFARKIHARIQKRYGPPFYQNIYDVIKLFSKREAAFHGGMFHFGPVLSLTGIIMALMFLPVGGKPLFSFQGDLFVLLYLAVIAPWGMALGAGNAENPLASVGIARALTLMLGYEIPFFIGIIPIVVRTHTTQIVEIIQLQQINGWNVILFPISALASIIALHAMLGNKPFDQPIAPHEIASGPLVEYGGKYLGILQLYQAGAILLSTGIYVDLFFGGASNVWMFFLKTFLIYFVLLLIGEVLPRFRIGDALKFF